MPLFPCFLFIFMTGNVLSESVNRECGGKIDVLRERSGSISYSFTSGVQPTNVINNRIIDYGIEKQLDAICTWIIDARVNQTVWIEVIYIDDNAQLWIKFRNHTTVKKHEKGVHALYSGAGTTTVEWSLRNVAKAPSKLNLRWNTSEDSHDLAQVPYTHSESDPVSPSPDRPNGVTPTPDILRFAGVSLRTHELWGGSVQQGGVPGLHDKSSLPFPQENTHNRQEKAGAMTSNLSYTAILSHASIHSKSSGSYTHTNAQTDTQTVPALALSSAKTQSSQVLGHTLTRHHDVGTATGTYLNTNGDNAAYRITHTNMLTLRSPLTGMHIATKIYSDVHNSIGNSPLSTTGPMVSSHTISSVHTDTEASEAVSNIHSLIYRSNITTASIDSHVSIAPASGGKNRPRTATFEVTPGNIALGTETERTNRNTRSTHSKQDTSSQIYTSVSDDSDTISGTSVAVSYNQVNVSTFSDQDNSPQSQTESNYLQPVTTTTKAIVYTALTEHHTRSLNYTHSPNTHSIQPTQKVYSQNTGNTHTSHTIARQTSSTSQPNTTKQLGSTKTLDLNTQQSTIPSSVFTSLLITAPSELPVNPVTSVEEESEGYMSSIFTSAPQSPNTDIRDGATFPSTTNIPPVLTINATVIPNLMSQGTITTQAQHGNRGVWFNMATLKAPTTQMHTQSVPGTETNTNKRQHDLPHTLSPQFSSTLAHRTETNTTMHHFTRFALTNHSSNGSHSNSSRSAVSLGPTTSVSFSPSVSTVTGSTEAKHMIAEHSVWTLSNDTVSPTAASHVILHSPVASTAGEAVNTHRELYEVTDMTQVTHPPVVTTPWPKPTPTRHQDSISSTLNGRTPAIQTHGPVVQSATQTPVVQVDTKSSHSQTGTRAPSTAPSTATLMSWLHPFTVKNDKELSHKGRVFIVENQPPIIKVETFQVLLQVTLERNSSFPVGLSEVEPFLHKVAGYQNQHLTWHSGAVLQTVVTFQTMKALSWLGRAESLLSQAGLNPLPRAGIFVGGIRVKNITVGGLHSDMCSWLFECPPGFQCGSSGGNATCSSACHSDYCRHHGICVHRPGEPPLCQCPVGEDFWFMGQRCDLRMTRQRLVGMCVGVLAVAAVVMALLSYLAVRRFKSMLIQAKVDQTRSSYRRFNHFDELSARFWGRSWPGSEDSLDNPTFTRSDELLHMRAMDRTCCYHDDTLSIASTYQGSTTHLSTIYPRSSQYHWNLSNYSLADCVIDSGKASDLSVCSWPIEPIQWTPFPLLQQLNRNNHSVKASRPRSYCEGMELVDLEKTWTA